MNMNNDIVCVGVLPESNALRRTFPSYATVFPTLDRTPYPDIRPDKIRERYGIPGHAKVAFASNHPVLLEHFPPENVMVFYNGQYKRLSEHPEYRHWKQLLNSAEFYYKISSDDYTWITGQK